MRQIMTWNRYLLAALLAVLPGLSFAEEPTNQADAAPQNWGPIYMESGAAAVEEPEWEELVAPTDPPPIRPTSKDLRRPLHTIQFVVPRLEPGGEEQVYGMPRQATHATLVRWRVPKIVDRPVHFSDHPLEWAGFTKCPKIQPAVSASKFYLDALSWPVQALKPKRCQSCGK